jgi:hypothetical protein
MKTDELIGVWCLAAYLHETSGYQFVNDVFGDVHPNYANEKATAYAEAPSRALGLLDDEHFKKLATIAIERHGGEARRRFMSPMDKLRTFMDNKDGN